MGDAVPIGETGGPGAVKLPGENAIRAMRDRVYEHLTISYAAPD